MAINLAKASEIPKYVALAKHLMQALDASLVTFTTRPLLCSGVLRIRIT